MVIGGQIFQRLQSSSTWGWDSIREEEFDIIQIAKGLFCAPNNINCVCQLNTLNVYDLTEMCGAL